MGESLDTKEARRKTIENKCIRKLLRTPWTKLITTAQVYKMAGTENELLNYTKCYKTLLTRDYFDATASNWNTSAHRAP